MIKPADILWLGVSAGVIGCLVGGSLLGIGMAMVLSGVHVGWLFMLPAAPIGGVPGWILARKLAKQL
jgi:hypothetical protein